MRVYASYPRVRYQPRVTRFVNPFNGFYFKPGLDNQAMRMPSANILREEGAYVIKLAVPGLGKDQIKIEVDQDKLIIAALEPKSDEKTGFVRREFDYAGFKRTFSLHQNANTEAMTAGFDQGILTIVIPDKTPETRKIEIV